MINNKFSKRVILFLILVSSVCVADDTLEQGLINAIEQNKTNTSRDTLYGSAIRAYKTKGFINNKPNQRADYTDYYLLNKPATFMGHDLKVIEEEYMSAYIGCCVNSGLGLGLKIRGSLTSLKAFANENGCSVEENINLYQELTESGLKVHPMSGRYARLSCRERDLDATNTNNANGHS